MELKRRWQIFGLTHRWCVYPLGASTLDTETEKPNTLDNAEKLVFCFVGVLRYTLRDASTFNTIYIYTCKESI